MKAMVSGYSSLRASISLIWVIRSSLQGGWGDKRGRGADEEGTVSGYSSLRASISLI